MTNHDPTTTGKAIPELVKELIEYQKKWHKLIPIKPWSDCIVIMAREIGERESFPTHPALQEYVKDMFNAFPAIAKTFLEQGEKLRITVEALQKITKVSQFGRDNGPIVTSEHYEACWLDCAEIAKQTLAIINQKTLADNQPKL